MMNDNRSIENFFRNRIENGHIDYQESDWERLEAKLNQIKPLSLVQAPAFFSIKYVSIILSSLIGMFFLGWFARDWFIDQNTGVRKEHNILILPDEEKTESTQNAKEKSQHKNQLNKRLKVNENSANKDNTFKSKETGASSIDKITRAPKNMDSLPNQTNENKETKNVNMSKSLESKTSTNKIDDQLLKRKKISTLIKDGIAADPSNLTKTQPIFGTLENSSNMKDGLIWKQSNTYAEDKLNLPGWKHFLSKWQIGIGFAPDFNSTGSFNNQTFSGKLGGSIHYAPFENFEFSSGVFYNNKKYDTEAKEYEPPYGYWNRRTNGVVPDNIIGSCRVIDIPVMVHYQFSDFQKLQFSVGAGLSNYLLLNENYNFEFANENPGAANGWYTDENTHAGWSIANATLRIELELSRGFTFSGEPYLKIPLKKIGWGNIELYGMGILFGLKYKLAKY